MNSFTLICYMGVIASSLFVLAQATVGGQYSVNVHFVPPLVTAPCQVAQFWSPPNVTCGMCFCMTGALSRCIPQPGCNPNNPNTGNSTESSTMTSSSEAPSVAPAAPGGDTGDNPPAAEGTPAEAPAAEGPAEGPAAPAEGEPATAPAETPAAEGQGSNMKTNSKLDKKRASKPGKLRRRRHS